MRDLVTPSTQTHTHTHTHTHECYTHTHERGWADAEGEQDTERGPLGASAKATATRRKDQKMKVGGRRFEFRRGMHSTARRSTTTTTSHLRGPIYIRLTSRRDRETTRAVANQRGTRGVSRGTVFFTARDDAFDSRDTFKDADGPSKGFVGDTHTHARDVAIELHRPPAPSTFDERRRRACSGAHRHRAIDGYR